MNAELIKKYLLSVSNSDTPKISDNKLFFSDKSKPIEFGKKKKVHEVYFGGLKLNISSGLKESPQSIPFGIKNDTLWISVQNISVVSIEPYSVLINGQSNERSNSKSRNDSISWLEQINFEKKSDRLIAQIDTPHSSSPIDKKTFFLDFEALYSSNTKSTRTRLVLREGPPNAKEDVTSSQSDNSPVIISHHPFSVCKISKYGIDSDTDDIIAEWDSEEPTGLWLFPVLSVDLDLPPQGVAQEMEKGKRYWDNDKPTIELDKPVKTRICGITALSLAHKDLASRRYVLPPNAIEHWLSKSSVQKLTFEAVYPLQVNYEKDKFSDTSITIDEIGNHILSPAIPWDPVKKEDIFKDINLTKWLSPGMVNFASNKQNEAYWKNWLDQYKFRRLTHIGAGIGLQRRVARYNIINEGQPKKPLNLSGTEVTAKLVPPNIDKDYYKEIFNLEGEDPNYPRKTAYPIAEKDSAAIISDFFSNTSTQHIGLLGLFEFQSELNAVLRNRNATSLTTKIDYLLLSAIGATTQLEASFDEGRTSFHVEVVDAHSVKLIKTRIGRIACIKNKAKHIVEYIISVCPSSQFAEEQGEKKNLTDEQIKYLKLGWPIIRKSDEYIQIEEQRRVFSDEPSLDNTQSAKIKASYFPSNKIYVNSAWGEELEHGYKIPLFKENDPSGFYIKPVYALVCFGKDGEDANHYHDQPQNAYFYTNTQEGKGADSDAWEHFISIDYRSDAYTPALYECINPFKVDRPIVTPALSTKWQNNPKFDWLVRSESPCNLVHGRDGASEPLLANVSVISIDRREARNPRLNFLKSSYIDIYNLLVLDPTTAPPTPAPPTPVSVSLQQAADLRTLEALINRLPAELEKIIIGFANPSINCEEIKSECINKINQYFDEGQKRLGNLNLDGALIPAINSIDLFIEKQFGVIEKEIEQAKKIVVEKKVSFDNAISELMLATAPEDLRKKLRQVCETELLTFIDKSYNRIDYQAKETFANISKSLESVNKQCNEFDTNFQKLLHELKGIHQAIDTWDESTDITQAIDEIKVAIINQLNAINNAATQLDTIENQLQTQILKSSGFINDILKICITNVQFLKRLIKQTIKQLTQEEVEALFERIKSEIKNNTSSDLETKKNVVKQNIEQHIDSQISFIDQKKLGLDSTFKEFKSLVSNNLENELNNFKETIYGPLWGVYEKPDKSLSKLIDYLAYLSLSLPNNSNLVQAISNFEQLHSNILNTLDKSETKVKSLKNITRTSVNDVFKAIENAQINFEKSVSFEWKILRQELLNQVNSINCSDADNFIKNIKEKYIKPAEDWLKDTVNEGVAKIIDQRALERYKDLQREIEIETKYSEYKKVFESKQSAVLTLSEMITHPPQLPNLNLSSQSLALAFAGDTSAIINTAPFIARIDAAKGALSALGIDTTHNAITDTFDAIVDDLSIYKDQLQNKLSNCLKKLGGLDSLFSKFDDALNSKEFKIVNITKDGRVSLKPELQKFIPQERPILESGVFAVALNNTYLNVVADIETEIITAKVRANWALKFNGQALVVFENVQLIYASNGDYHFELDPQNVRLHPSLKFISDLMSAVENSLPPGVEFEKGSQNQIIGVKASLVQQFPGFSTAAATIGPFSIQSWFGLRFASGAMELIAGFGLGTQSAPVYIQFGAYGGGGWLGANVLYNPNSAKLPVDYQGFMGIAVGSMQQFNIAGIARGSYAILIFAYANFSSSTTYLEAGLLVNGSARILGYINAHLTLKLSVEYNGSKARGKGEIDLEIEICWCYSVHIQSAVDQDF